MSPHQTIAVVAKRVQEPLSTTSAAPPPPTPSPPPARATAAAPARPSSAPNNSTAVCSHRGVFNDDLGVCRCTAGWDGRRCEIRDARPCNSAPGSAIINVESLCAGECDDDRGICYCAGLDQPHRRPLPFQCKPGVHLETRLPDGRYGFPAREPSGSWGRAHVYYETSGDTAGWHGADMLPFESLYGVVAGNPRSPRLKHLKSHPLARPLCSPDFNRTDRQPCGGACPPGRTGFLCEGYKREFCLRDCSGHGRCDSGFCWCDEGWFGIDCSRSRNRSRAASLQSVQRLPSPAAADASALRIYVYDMPSEFTTRQLQWRVSPDVGVSRTITDANHSAHHMGSLYSVELALHEWLLDSPLRTDDASQAHLFYVPIYLASIFMWPIVKFADAPYYGRERDEPRFRSHQGSLLMLRALEHIRRDYPWWNASAGRDHVWLMLHDEGPCFCPREIRSSILLTHYGYYAEVPRNWGTFQDDDFMAAPAFYDRYLGDSSRPTQCFKRDKDLVIPPWKTPVFWRSALRKSAEQLSAPRKGLVFFAGDLGFNRIAGYSHNLRQLAFALFCDPRTTKKSACTPVAYDRRCDCECRHDMPQNCSLWKPGVSIRKHSSRYSAELEEHTFCLAFPGDGWSSRVLDAVIHGCIPVIVQDESEMFFEGAFAAAGLGVDYANFSLRLAEAELPTLVDVLERVPAERVKELRMAALSVRDYFVYKDMYNPDVEDRKQLLETGARGRDAFWLIARTLLVRARAVLPAVGRTPPMASWL